MDSGEWQRNIFLTHAQEATDTNHQRRDLAGLVHQNVVDLADGVLCFVIDVLLIVVGNCPAIGRQVRHRLSRERWGRKRSYYGKHIDLFYYNSPVRLFVALQRGVMGNVP